MKIILLFVSSKYAFPLPLHFHISIIFDYILGRISPPTPPPNRQNFNFPLFWDKLGILQNYLQGAQERSFRDFIVRRGTHAEAVCCNAAKYISHDITLTCAKE